MDIVISAAHHGVLPIDIDAVESMLSQKSDGTVGKTIAIQFGRCSVREMFRSSPPSHRDQELQPVVFLLEVAQFRQVPWIDGGVAQRYLAGIDIGEGVNDVGELGRIDIARRIITAVSAPGNVIAGNRVVWRLTLSVQHTGRSNHEGDQGCHSEIHQPAGQPEQYPHQFIFDRLSSSNMAIAQAQLSKRP